MNTPAMIGWQAPIPFNEFDLPPFPTDALPGWLREWVEALSTDTQTPTDLAAMLSLAVVATTSAKKFKVVITPSWNVPVNGYFVVALPPGNRKSAVYTAASRPLERYMSEEGKRLRPEILSATTRQKIAANRLKNAETKASKASDEHRQDLEKKAEDLAKELAEIEVPVVPRLIADDVTSEKLEMLLATHGGRMAILSEEGGIFDLMAGRYARDGSPNFEVYLKGWDGGEIRVDRVSRRDEHVSEPALTLGLTVQPAVLQGLTSKPGFRGRGLLARFFYGMPRSWVGHRATNPPSLPEHIRAAYERNIIALLQLLPEKDHHGKPRAHDLCLAHDARAALDRFREELEPRLRAFADLELYADWATKLAGGIARLAGLLHVAQYAEKGQSWEVPVAVGTLEDAIRIGQYLIPHAKAAFAEMGADPEVELAKYILRWLERNGKQSFSKREAFNALRGRFERVDAMIIPLELLVAHNYIRLAQQSLRHGAGRKPSPEFEVNPLWLPQNSHFTQNPGTQGNSAECADSAYPVPDPLERSGNADIPEADLEEGVL